MIDKKYLAHNGINNEFECFDTIEEARLYLVDSFLVNGEGYHPDLECCNIYKLEETVEYDVIAEVGDTYGDKILEDEIWRHKFIDRKGKQTPNYKDLNIPKEEPK